MDDAAVAPLKARARLVPLGAGGAIVFNDRFIHSSGPNASEHIRWSVDLRYQPTDQDPMPQYGTGFLARSRVHPERVASLDDWCAGRPEAGVGGT
jgi:ectoine hydroxylase-related dioxygenase (phytanoyl-CoA dioxygenase family)